MDIRPKFIAICDGQIKINPLGEDSELCQICENKNSKEIAMCMYCFHLDMFWYKDQETTNRLIKEYREIKKQ